MSCRSCCCWFGTFGPVGSHWGLSADLRLENEVHPKILNLKDLIGFMFFFLDRGNDFVILVLSKSWLNQALNLSNDLVLGEDDWRSDNVGSSKIKDHWINNQLGGSYIVRWDLVGPDPRYHGWVYLAGSSLNNSSNDIITGNRLNFYWQYIAPVIGKRCQSGRIICF